MGGGARWVSRQVGRRKGEERACDTRKGGGVEAEKGVGGRATHDETAFEAAEETEAATDETLEDIASMISPSRSLIGSLPRESVGRAGDSRRRRLGTDARSRLERARARALGGAAGGRAGGVFGPGGGGGSEV